MNGRALVTGGAGFIGSHLVERLVDEGWMVLVVDNLSAGHLDNLAATRGRGKVKFHQLDIRDDEFASVVLRFRPDVLFHLAAQNSVAASVEDPLGDASVNILGTVAVLESARRAGVERVMFASSGTAIYGQHDKLPVRETSARHPASPLGVSKSTVEAYFRWYRETGGPDYVVLAPSNVYGPRQDPLGASGVVAIFARLMLDGRRPVIYGDGEQTRDFVFVDDTVDAFVRAGQVGGGRLFNIGTGRETSILDLFKALTDRVGFDQLPVFGDARAGEPIRSVVDPSAARKHLGWSAWTALEEGLNITVGWLRQHR